VLNAKSIANIAMNEKKRFIVLFIIIPLFIVNNISKNLKNFNLITYNYDL